MSTTKKAKTKTKKITTAVGTAIREAREKKKLSQSALATKVGISPQHLSGIENGRATLQPVRFQAMNKALRFKKGQLIELVAADFTAGYLKASKTKGAK